MQALDVPVDAVEDPRRLSEDADEVIAQRVHTAWQLRSSSFSAEVHEAYLPTGLAAYCNNDVGSCDAAVVSDTIEASANELGADFHRYCVMRMHVIFGRTHPQSHMITRVVGHCADPP